MNNPPPPRHSILPPSRTSNYPTSSTSTNAHLPASQQPILQSRIALKRAELTHLKQLRDLSGQLASQMTELETKLSTLRDGAEAVALVMRNWEGVLGVIGMAGASAAQFAEQREESDGETKDDQERGAELPVTLVRIPVDAQRRHEQELEGGNGGG